MAIKLVEPGSDNVLEVSLSGKLAKKDYETFVPAVERWVKQQGKVRMLVRMHDFHGWTVGALWEDTKFAAHHFKDIERVAVLGETKWQQGMTVFCKPFTTASLRYFEVEQAAAARDWLGES